MGTMLYGLVQGSAKTPEQWLHARLTRGRSEFFSEVVTISPDLAKVMLAECNKDNRPIRKTKVEKWVSTMKDGRWMLMSQGIAFASDGRLNNGQHRLTAVVESGKSVEFLVFFGEPRAAFDITDTQAPRSGGDVLHAAGIRNGRDVAATARLLFDIERGVSRGMHAPTNDVLKDVLAAHPDIVSVVSWAKGVANAVKAGAAPVSVAAYLITRKYPVNEVKDWFTHRVRDGLYIESDRDPVFRLRAVYPTLKGRQSPVAAVTIKAWNASRKGAQIKVLAWRNDEPFPKVV